MHLAGRISFFILLGLCVVAPALWYAGILRPVEIALPADPPVAAASPVAQAPADPTQAEELPAVAEEPSAAELDVPSVDEVDPNPTVLEPPTPEMIAETEAPEDAKARKEPDPASVAAVTEALGQIDPFVDGLTDLAAAEEAIDPIIKEAIPVMDLSTTAEPANDDEPVDANAFELLGSKVASGTRKQLSWSATETFSGAPVPTPVLVVHGAQSGPVMCLTAGVHGDELNGIETVRRIIHNTKPEKLKGTLIGVPIVNIQGFQRQSRYLPDRRDLNRFFPGHPKGSSASRIAHTFFDAVIRKCDALVDLHTGSFHRTNLPQLRANLNDPNVVALSQSFGSTVVIHSEGGVGTLRRAAVEAGIPAVTLEAGEPLRLQEDKVEHSVKGINTLLARYKMYKRRNIWNNSEAVYYTSRWVRSNNGGILFSKVALGSRVEATELLGTVTDPVSNEQEEVRAPFSGRVIGMAINQFVMPGFATFHLGVEADDVAEAKAVEEPTILSHDVAFDPSNRDDTEPTEE